MAKRKKPLDPDSKRLIAVMDAIAEKGRTVSDRGFTIPSKELLDGLDRRIEEAQARQVRHWLDDASRWGALAPPPLTDKQKALRAAVQDVRKQWETLGEALAELEDMI